MLIDSGGKMKKQRYIYMVRGIGIGFIVAAMIFFSLKGVFITESQKELTDYEVMEQAKGLGMVPITDIDNVVLTEEELIEKAKNLGMDFIEEE